MLGSFQLGSIQYGDQGANWVYLVGTVTATSGASGTLSVATQLVGASDGVSTATAALSVATRLVGSVPSISNTTASLSVATLLDGSASAVSNTAASLSVATLLVGSVSSVSGTQSALGFLVLLVGSTSAVSSTAASLGVLTTLASVSSGISGEFASISVLITLVGSVAGVSNTVASVSVLTSLVGLSAGVSNTVASLSIPGKKIALIGSVASVPNTVASVSVLTTFAGASNAASTVIGVGSVLTTLEGASTAVSSVTSGPFNVQPGLVGSVDAVSELAAVLLNVQPGLFGLVSAVSTTTAAMAVIPGFGATGIPWRPHDGILETLEWKTSILKAFNGTEQRIKSRQSPRQFFKLRFLFGTDKKNSQYEAMLFSRQKETWLIPVWSEFVEHTTDINMHDTTISVDTTFADYRPNNKALIWKSETEYEFVAIASVTDSLLTLDPSYAIQCDFTGDKLIMPVRTAYMVSQNRKSKTNSPVAFVDAVFAVTDNTDIAGYAQADSYDSLNLLIVPAFMEGVHLESSDADSITLDYGTGVFSVVSDSIYNFLSQSHVFYNDTKQAAWEFRQFLYSLDGRQKTVLIPTFRDDLAQVSSINIEPSDTSVTIENIRLAKNMGLNDLRTYIGFYFSTTNVLIVRKITAITELSPEQEQIDFDVNLDLTAAVSAGDCKICFVDKARLASDKVEIRWLRSHYNQCATNFMRVP